MKGKLTILTLLLVICFLVAFFGYLQAYDFNPEISKTKLITYEELDHYQPIQIVLIVVDALRFDFAQRIPYLQQMTNTHADRAHLKKLVAALPTYTVTNVKAMLTGSNPFQFGKLYEMVYQKQMQMDNIASQLISNGNQTMMMGDDVWRTTYQFTSTEYSCGRTFDIYKRTLSCQQNIYLNFNSVVKQKLSNNNQAAYSFIVAHFLQLDHSTHAYGVPNNPYLPSIFARLQYNIQNFCDSIEDETIIIVLGDHGTQQNGMHCGITDLQRQATFFSYYKTNNATLNSFYKQHKQDPFNSTAKTVDLASTFSILLNTNLPSNSFGFPILDILPIKFHKYFPQIQLNVLKSYKKNIDFYGIQKDRRCYKINEWITDSSKNQQNIYHPKYYYQRREKIIDDLYDHCLVQITLAKPLFVFWLILPVLIGLMVGIWLHNFPSNQRKLTKPFIMEQVAWIATKFLIAFIQVLIYAQIPYLQVVIIGFILFEDSINKKYKMLCIIALIAASLFEASYLDIYYHSLFYNQLVSTYIKSSNNLLLGVYILWSGYQIYSIIAELKSMPIPKTQKKKEEQSYGVYIKNIVLHKIKTKIAFLCVTASNCLEIIIIILTVINQIRTFESERAFQIRIMLLQLMAVAIFLRIILHVVRIKYKRQQQLREISNEGNAKLYFSRKFNINVLIIAIFSCFSEKYEFVLLVILQITINLLNRNKINFLLSYLMTEIIWRKNGTVYEIGSIKIQYSFVFGEQFQVARNVIAFVIFFCGIHCITLSQIYRHISLNQKQKKQSQINQSESIIDIKASLPPLNQSKSVSIHEQTIQAVQPSVQMDKSTSSGQPQQYLADQSPTKPQPQLKASLDQKPLVVDQFQNKQNESNFLIKKSDKINQQRFWNELGKYCLIPLTGFLSTVINLSVRTGTFQSMFYTIMMMVQTFEMAFLLIILIIIFVRWITKCIDRGLDKFMGK